MPSLTRVRVVLPAVCISAPPLAAASRAQLAWRTEALLIVAALGLAVLPVLMIELPGFIDLPNNVARASIRADLGVEPFYDLLFRRNATLVPNAAFDVFYGLASGVLSPIAIGRVFATVTILTTVTGVIALARALGSHVALAALLGALLAHDYSLVWGFLNYQLGIGLLLWGTVLWLRVRGRGLGAVLGPCVLALALYYCHVLPLALYGVVLCGIELEQWRRQRAPWSSGLRALAVIGIPFLLPATMFLAGSTAGELQHIEAPDLLTSLRGCAKALHAGLGLADYFHLASLAGLGALAATLGRLRLAHGVRWSLLLLAAICLLAPDKTEEAACLQQRLPIVFAFLGAAALQWTPTRACFTRVLLLAAGLALGARTVALMFSYNDRAALVRDAVEVLGVVPDRALLFTMVGPLDRGDGWEKYRVPLLHVACLRALTGPVFLPQLLVSTLHHTVAPASPVVNEFCQMFALRSAVNSPDDVRARVAELRDKSTHAVAQRECPPLTGGLWIVAVHFPPEFAFPADVLTLVAHTPGVQILRVR